MKRIITFMMALALILSLSIGAFAAGTGSITITNAVPEKTYNLYKIFDATYKDSNVTYTIKPGDEFFSALFGDGTGTNDYFEYHAATGVVTRKEGKTDAQLFSYLSGLIAGHTPLTSETAAADSTTVKFDNLDFGYYLIKRSDEGANAVTITTAKPTAEVNDKNAGIGGDLDKSSDKDAVSVGDTITWTVSFTATNYSKGEKVLNYTVTDTLNRPWADIDTDNIVVKVNGAEISNYTISGASDSGFVIDIPWVDADDNFLYPATSIVEITYSAVVLDAAAANDPASNVNKNHAELEFDTETKPNQPGGDDVTKTNVYNLGFTKVDGTNPDKTLAGATFALYSDNACTVPVNVSVVSDGVYMVDADATSNLVVTPADGKVVIKGLPAGDYYLKETEAPDGYNLLTEPVKVTIVADEFDEKGAVTKSNAIDFKAGDTTYKVNNAAEYKIENFAGVELPSTGGEGTMMMITIGTMVAMAFAVLMITQKKMSIYQD
jgi:LPXTG-motif cell wall-anchored protein/uncharacterized repeat protein (TIGR01451 family)